MANKPLKSIKFPGLSDTYTVPEVDSTLTGSGKAADAKAVGDQLGDLKSAFSSDLVSIHPTWVQGKYIEPDTGNVGTSSSFYATEYFAVMPNSYVQFYAAIAATAGVAFYDENKYFVSGYADENLYQQRTLQVPENAYFMRYSCRADYHDSASRQEQIGTIYFLNQIDALNESLPDISGMPIALAKKLDTINGWSAVTATGISAFTTIANTLGSGGYGASCSVSEGEVYRISGRQFSSYPTDSTPSNAPAYLLRNNGSIVKIGWIAEAGYFTDLEVLIPSGVDELVVNLNSSAGLSAAIKKAILTNHDTVYQLTQRTEALANMVNMANAVIGLAWNHTANVQKAILYVPITGGTVYYVSAPSSTVITKVSILQLDYEWGNSLATTAVNSGSNATITANANAVMFCVQFESGSTITQEMLDAYALSIVPYRSGSVTPVDYYARQADSNTFGTFYKVAEAHRKGVNNVGRTPIVSRVANPKTLSHQQEAWGTAYYYDVNSTVNQYEVVGGITAPYEYIANHLPQEEIDFTPSDDGFTRIICGKSDDDVFFVSYVASLRAGDFGDADNDALEITSDFESFTTILHSSEVSGDGISVSDMTYMKVQAVKQFADGSFLIPIRGHKVSTDADMTKFYRLSADMSTLTALTYTDLNGNTQDMVDEFNGQVYDWHVNIQGEKGIVTTYGSRDPSTDYGRVWYTEDCGQTWKQVFQMTNHYQDGVDAGTTITQTHMHGVFLDPYSDRMYVVAGEDNRNIFWSDKGWDTTDSDWHVIPIRAQTFYQIRGYSQVVGGYAFRDNLVFGSDNSGLGTIDRLNKLNDGDYSKLEPAHEFLPNAFKGTNYCQAEIFRKNLQTPLLLCMTHENAGLTEEDNEALNNKHRGRIVASYDGVTWVEVWRDDTYGTHAANIDGTDVTRNYSYCTRGMNCYLLKNGDAIIKYSGRDFYYFGGDPLYSVVGYSNGSCKVRKIHGLEKWLK